MPKIVPIAELRDTKHVLHMCRATKEPIIVTKNGYGELVIMSITAFTEMSEELDKLRKLVAKDTKY
ncbi:MAG: type II toxin-antitoxin system Phd/YefM family antitoxin [Clostridiaceae bacterium]|jgi:prevent-host-death family protein|nr:type II toxin-antitoxin system Phd/YefM family antitoxin [Clostridiaceae bacterium]